MTPDHSPAAEYEKRRRKQQAERKLIEDVYSGARPIPSKPPKIKSSDSDYSQHKGIGIVGKKSALVVGLTGAPSTGRSSRANTSLAGLQAILTKSDRRCYLCRCDLSIASMVVEHVIPRARGGNDEQENLYGACAECNSKKGSKVVAFMVASRKPIYMDLPR